MVNGDEDWAIVQSNELMISMPQSNNQRNEAVPSDRTIKTVPSNDVSLLYAVKKKKLESACVSKS